MKFKIKWPVIRRGFYRYNAMQNAIELVRIQQVRLIMDTREWMGNEFDKLREMIPQPAPADAEKEDEN